MLLTGITFGVGAMVDPCRKDYDSSKFSQTTSKALVVAIASDLLIAITALVLGILAVTGVIHFLPGSMGWGTMIGGATALLTPAAVVIGFIGIAIGKCVEKQQQPRSKVYRN